MKKVLKKILLILMFLIIINNFFIAYSYASEEAVLNVFAGLLGGIAGFLTLIPRLLALGVGWLIEKFSALVAYTEGATDVSVNTSTITPFDIFFNKVKLLDINFFDISTDSNFINTMRTSVASWYYIMRIIASAILLVILIYVGIRMVFSTVASDKASYKKMLVDWVCSLALVFLLHYIVIFTINVNNSIVKVIENSVDNTNVAETYKVIRDMGKAVFDLTSIGATIIYFMLVWQTLGIIVSYFNRMLKVAFLIIISPLITITYSIDKMGDGKAQALNTWLKEIIFTILIQPFHCVIYMCLIDTAFNLLTEASDSVDKLARGLIAIVMIRFIKEAEKIVRKIFAFKDDNSKTSMAMAMATTGIMINQAKNFGKTARSVGKGTVGVGKGLNSFRKNAVLEISAASRTFKNRGESENSFSKHKEEIQKEKNDKKVKKIAEKKNYRLAPMLAQGEEVKKDTDILATEIEEEKQRIMENSNGTISADLAESQARLNLVKNKRKENGFVNKKIKGRVGNITNKINKKMSPAMKESLAVIKDMGKDYLKLSAAGAAGLIVGSGLYGTGENIFSSVAIGSALGAGVYDLGTRTSKTLSNNVKGYLDNLGVTDSKGAREEIQNKVLNEKKKFGDGTEADKERKKIVEELNKALEGFGIDSSTRNTITNKVMSDLQENPATAPDSIKRALSGLQYKNPNTGAEMSFEEASSDNSGISNVLQYANRNAIYNEIKTAEEIDISSGDIIEKVSDTYDKEKLSLRSADKAYEEIRETENIEEKAEIFAKSDDDEMEKILDNYSEEQQRIEAEFNYYNNEKEKCLEKNDEKQAKKYEEQAAILANIANEINNEQMKVVAIALAQKKQELSEHNKKLLREYIDKIEVEINKNNNTDESLKKLYYDELKNISNEKIF